MNDWKDLYHEEQDDYNNYWEAGADWPIFQALSQKYSVLGIISYSPRIESIFLQCPYCKKWWYWSQLFYVDVYCCDCRDNHDGVKCPDCKGITSLATGIVRDIGYNIVEECGGYLSWDWVA